MPLDSRPSLCCSSLQVNQEDQKLGFNFQTVLKLNIVVHFLALFLAGGSLGPNESYYRSVFLIKLSFTNLVITVWPSPTVELFSQVYPVIQKTSACTVLLFQLWSLKNRKSIKKKTDRNCWYAWAPLQFVFFENGKATTQNFCSIEPCNT